MLRTALGCVHRTRRDPRRYLSVCLYIYGFGHGTGHHVGVDARPQARTGNRSPRGPLCVLYL